MAVLIVLRTVSFLSNGDSDGRILRLGAAIGLPRASKAYSRRFFSLCFNDSINARLTASYLRFTAFSWDWRLKIGIGRLLVRLY